MAKVTTAYIGLGSNLGDRESWINKALKLLAETEAIEVARVSDIIETKPLGAADEPEYLNAVAEIKTSLSAEALHNRLTDIESKLGRVKREKWAPRIIDLDLLLFGNEVVRQPSLTVPHPQMHLRWFVLKGLCQLNIELPHPIMKESMGELAARLGGADFVLDSEKPQLVSIAGIIGVGKTTLTKRLSKLFDCKPLLEPYDANPFMPDVYAGRKDLALDSQLYFLTHRTTQLNITTLPRRQIAFSDYVFDKELIYARRLLDAEQLSLYEKTYPAFAAKVSHPVLVIYLTDEVERCLQRIHVRNRSYEQQIQPQFLQDLDSDYQQLFSRWKTCPVIRKQMSELDSTGDEDIEHLANQIKCYVTQD